MHTFAGRGDDVVFVADRTSSPVRAFDSETLEPVPGRDVLLPAAPISVWIDDGETHWIDASRTLHVGDATLPGAYVWVR